MNAKHTFLRPNIRKSLSKSLSRQSPVGPNAPHKTEKEIYVPKKMFGMQAGAAVAAVAATMMHGRCIGLECRLKYNNRQVHMDLVN